MKRRYDATIGRFENSGNILPLISGSIMNPDQTLLSSAYLCFQKDLLLNIAKRIGFDFSLVTVFSSRNDDGKKYNEKYGKMLSLSLGNVVSKCLRRTDLLFESSADKQIFTILLPCADKNGAGVVAKRVQDTISCLKGKLLEEAAFSYEIEELYVSKAA